MPYNYELNSTAIMNHIQNLWYVRGRERLNYTDISEQIIKIHSSRGTFSTKKYLYSYFFMKTGFGYSLEVPHWGASNKYTQSIFLWGRGGVWERKHEYPQHTFLWRNWGATFIYSKGLLMSIQNIPFRGEIRKNIGYPLIWCYEISGLFGLKRKKKNKEKKNTTKKHPDPV